LAALRRKSKHWLARKSPVSR